MAGLLVTPAFVAQVSPTQAEEITPVSANVEKFTQAMATFSDSTPSKTLSTLNTAVTKVKTAYGKLTAEEKKAISEEVAKNYAQIQATYTIAKRIDELSKKTDEAIKLDSAINDTMTEFDNLEAYQRYVFNYSTLTKLSDSVAEVIILEQDMIEMTPANTLTKVAEIVAAYNELTATQRKYLTDASQATITSWRQALTASTQLIKEIDAITTTSFATWGSATESSKATAVKQFNTKVNAALTKLEKITLASVSAEVDPQALVTNKGRLVALKDFTAISTPVLELNTDLSRVTETVNAAKATLETFDGKMTEHSANLSEIDKKNLPGLKIFLAEYVAYIEDEQAIIVDVENIINALKDKVDLVTLASAREKFNSLSSEGKKFVSNISQLTALEATYKSALAVVKQIEAIDPSAKDFVSKTTAAKAAYDKLATEALKSTVTNYMTVENYLPIALIMKEIDAIRVNSAEFRKDYEAAQGTYNALTAGVTGNPESSPAPTDKVIVGKQRLVTEYGPKLDTFKATIATIDSITARIEGLSSKTGQSFMEELKRLSEEYKRLDSATKSNILNAQDLTTFEKDYNASLKVFNVIEQLPENTDLQFSKKVNTAEKAFQKLTTVQKGNVYNYDKLSSLLKPAAIIERINKLKTTSKTYETDVQDLRKEFEELTTNEKTIVHNIGKLVEAEENMNQAETVIALINAAIPTAEDYLVKLREAREAYDKLDRTRQSLILNYKELTSRERAMRPIIKLDQDILNLDPSNAKTFISKYKSAQKAYEKLSLVDRNLLENDVLLLGDLKQLFDVIDAISTIKSSSKTYVKDTENARHLYNSLKPELQQKVSNLKVLIDHELNVAGGASVDAMIRNLKAVEPLQFIEAVKEVRKAYTSLNSSNKKAVSLIDELKTQEKYIKPVQKIIDEIEGLLNPRNNLARQFEKVNKSLQRLDDTQYTYITNIDKYSNLANVIHTYDLIEKLKPNDRYYQGNLEAAKTSYDRLSQEEKQKVTNYYKLQEAQLNVDEAKVVISLIGSLTSTASTYAADVATAAAAYKELPSNIRKQVTNYDVLKQAEKDLKVVAKVEKQIAAIDMTARNATSKVKSAKKAYDKLTLEQKPLVSNYQILQAAVFEMEL